MKSHPHTSGWLFCYTMFMNNEKPKNPHLRIEYMKDGLGEKSDSKAEDIDFSVPQEITPEFLSKIELSNPEKEQEKNELLKMLSEETDLEKRQQIQFALRQLLLS